MSAPVPPPRDGASANFGVIAALRVARRELRGGLRGFRIFLACLLLGVGTIATIGSLAAALEAGLRGEARNLLGGDVSAQLALRPATAAEREFLTASGTLSETVKLRAMARSAAGDRRSLIELRTADAAYPLYGSVELQPQGNLAAALAPVNGVFGAAVEPAMADRLGLSPGDEFRVGNATLRLAAIVDREPDAAFAGLAFGPRILVSQAALPATGLIQPGALADYDYRLRLPAGTDAAAWIARARADFPEAGWELRSAADASPSLRRLLDRVGFFLNLVGITALLIGAVGIANAVAGYVTSKTEAIATLKCLGASNLTVFSAYLLQIAALAGIGIAGGVMLGAVVPAALAPLAGKILPVSLPLGVYWGPLGLAALYGGLTTLAFTLWPLAAVGRIGPAALWRDRVVHTRRGLAPMALAGSAAAGLGLAILIVLTAPERRIAAWYVGGVAVAFLVFRLTAWLAIVGARYLPRPRQPLLRLALANLQRPGAPTARMVMSLGLGLAVLVVVTLVEGNLAREIDSQIADGAPAYFFLDIRSDQLGGFADIVHASADARLVEVPMLRGRIIRLNGTPVEEAKVAPEAQWALRGDRGLTYAATLPLGSRLAAGAWWPADYHGPPLVSFDAGLAHGMGLKPGDTLSVNLLGRDITARIANLREIDWVKLGINFAIVFAPGTLEAAPQTHLAALYATPGSADRIVHEITERYPNVSAIDVGEALAAVGRVVATIASGIRGVALVTLLAGVLVLGGAIAAGYRRRVYDAVMLKVLGATRGAIVASFMLEYLLLGLLTAAIAAALGTVAARAVVTGPLNADWTPLPGPLLVIACGGVILTLALGLAGTWRALGAKPARFLREE